jgi:hypothetical protein
LFLDDALELAEGFKQLCKVVAFDGAIGHKGVTLPEPSSPCKRLHTTGTARYPYVHG